MSARGALPCCDSNFVTGPLFCNVFSSFASPTTTHQLVLSVSAPSLSTSPFKVLIDSGCTRSFIDQRLVTLSSCKTSKLPSPISLRLFDGSVAPNGPIREYVDIDFSLPGAPQDHFRFLITSLGPSVSMALGYDWLSQRNPLIDWRTGTITFPADTQTEKEVTDTPTPASPSPCIPHIEIVSAAAFAALAEDAVCIGSVSEFAKRAGSAKETTTSDEEMLPSHIPSCYHDFADVFSKIKADKLPPHCPYDHSIELEPGSTVPFGPIY